MSDDHPDILEADEDGENHPGDKETLAPLHRSNQEQRRTDHTKESIEDSVLDERSDAHIPALTLIPKQLNILGELDNVECCRNNCDGKLDHSNVKNCCFKWNS